MNYYDAVPYHVLLGEELTMLDMVVENYSKTIARAIYDANPFSTPRDLTLTEIYVSFWVYPIIKKRMML